MSSVDTQSAAPETCSDNKSSESAELIVAKVTRVVGTEGNPPLEADPAVSELSRHSGCRVLDYFSTNTSEVEELFDSSGAEEPTHHRNPATMNMDALSQPGTSLPETQTPEGWAKVDVTPTIPGLPKQ